MFDFIYRYGLYFIIGFLVSLIVVQCVKYIRRNFADAEDYGEWMYRCTTIQEVIFILLTALSLAYLVIMYTR